MRCWHRRPEEVTVKRQHNEASACVSVKKRTIELIEEFVMCTKK